MLSELFLDRGGSWVSYGKNRASRNMQRDLQVLAIQVAILVTLSHASKVERPRGVSLTRAVLYDPTKEFVCFDGSGRMPFSRVNDDYCDCNDGSDEPGTSACPNGSFHCTNAGYKPQNIPSSRVNDGICDCCDGTDEWKNGDSCANTCKELWRAEHADLMRQAAAASRGVEIRKEYSTQGLQKKADDQENIAALRKEIEEIKAQEEDLKSRKDEAETLESTAKDAERVTWTSFKEKVQEQLNSRQAANAFTELDSNKDGSISVDELKEHSELDENPDDGEFTEDEAQEILMADSVEAPEFIEITWNKISDKYQSKPETETDAKLDTDPEIPDYDEHDDVDDDEDDDNDEEHDEEYDDEMDDEDYESDVDDLNTKPPPITEPSDETPPPVVEEVSEENTKVNLPDDPVWSVNTKLLIAQADEARKLYDEQQKKKSDLERDIQKLEKVIEMDFGPDEAFHALHGKCFDLDTHEYTYKLCPFDRAVQKPKDGGAETSLGRWGSWTGRGGNKYSSMKYLSGLRCWNGPDRSTSVNISCGDENKLLSASEPSRCEYRFEFTTPAACEAIHVPDQPHDEL